MEEIKNIKELEEKYPLCYKYFLSLKPVSISVCSHSISLNSDRSVRSYREYNFDDLEIFEKVLKVKWNY